MVLRLLLLVPFLGYVFTLPTDQKPLLAAPIEREGGLQLNSKGRPLHGRFLHITDFHPDPFYKVGASTEKDDACHKGHGPAGMFGAETTSCDSPLTLVNATFQWINDNLKDTIDFIIWTGDSARHDRDEDIPRTEKEIVASNEMMVNKFVEVFGKDDNLNDTDPTNDLTVPIVPSFGNNDIRPHNIFEPGPNQWTRTFASVWEKFIPEDQRHGFERGGWFFVEVIPNKLAVFSLNTMYFFNSNAAVDGCARKSEPGYEHMEWLRIRLQMLRERGMKAILTGHVPPARTERKISWDETCWQKYTLWMQQYRDVVVGSVYGHMNMDHFLIQDFKDIDFKAMNHGEVNKTAQDGAISIQASDEYLQDLRDDWSKIPDDPSRKTTQLGSGYGHGWVDQLKGAKGGKEKKSKKDKYLEEIGGEWAEHYSVSLVSASVVPNYFPTMRVVEYNISGLDVESSTLSQSPADLELETSESCTDDNQSIQDRKISLETKRKKKPRFTIPTPPSKSSPPGPAYSPQLFTWTSYTQYYANLTHINNATPSASMSKHHDPSPRPFKFEIEYDTRDDPVYRLKDLSVRSWLALARRIGDDKPPKEDRLGVVDLEDRDDEEKERGKEKIDMEIDDCEGEVDGGGVDVEKKKKTKDRKNKKHKKDKNKKKHDHDHGTKKAINKVWFTFVSRAFVETRSEDEIHRDFGREG